jgi:UDP-N-acetylglucosamine 2-epimerase
MLSELDINIIFPIHPRTQKIIDNKRIKVPSNIKIIPPVDFITSVILQKFSKYIISDSGGIQNEAWFLDKKCIVMRTETEWMEAIDAKNNILYDYSTPLEKFIKKFLLVKSEKFNFNEKPSINILNILCNDL